MRRFERILLSTRARRADAAAVSLAFELARSQGAQLSLADSVDDELPHEGPQSGDLLRRSRLRRRRRELDGLIEGWTLAKRPISCALSGNRTDGILRLLAGGEHDLALVDLDCHGEVGLASEELERLQAESPTPLLFVRQTSDATPRRIAVAIDPTDEDQDFGRRMLDLGRSLATSAGAELVIVSAWTPFGLDLLDNRDAQAGPSLIERCRQETESRQRALVASTDIAPEEIRFEAPRGAASEVLPAFCVAQGVDLLVIGHKGRQGLARAIFGNTAESVLERAPISVMTVPAERFEVLTRRLRRRSAPITDEGATSSRHAG